METTGAPQSSTAARHSGTLNISLIVDLYSRMRPHPVQVRLQACSGSSISTMGNFAVPRRRLLAMYRARLAVIFKGYLIHCLAWRRGGHASLGQSRKRETLGHLVTNSGTGKAHITGSSCGRGDISNKKRRGSQFR